MKKFKLGQLVVTRNCMTFAEENQVDLLELVERHMKCEWGDLCKADWELNDLSLETEGRLFSSYEVKGQKIYVITEWTRELTTVLMASDY